MQYRAVFIVSKRKQNNINCQYLVYVRRDKVKTDKMNEKDNVEMSM